MPSTVTLAEIHSEFLPSPVPYAVLSPIQQDPLPLCILLLGGGGTREALLDLQPVFDAWWGRLTIVTPI